MVFADLLEQVGSTGHFQVVHVTLLSMPILMMASHNLLQNFVAAVPPHHCTAHANISDPAMSPAETLLLSVPLDGQGKLERCRRYAQPQWDLLAKNMSEAMDKTTIKMEGCADGWSYNKTDMTSTIITEVQGSVFIKIDYNLCKYTVEVSEMLGFTFTVGFGVRFKIPKTNGAKCLHGRSACGSTGLRGSV